MQLSSFISLCYSDIMDLRPASKFSEKIPEVIWEKFVTNTYPEHEISESWEDLIQEIFEVCCKIWNILGLIFIIHSFMSNSQKRHSQDGWKSGVDFIHTKAIETQ